MVVVHRPLSPRVSRAARGRVLDDGRGRGTPALPGEIRSVELLAEKIQAYTGIPEKIYEELKKAHYTKAEELLVAYGKD